MLSWLAGTRLSSLGDVMWKDVPSPRASHAIAVSHPEAHQIMDAAAVEAVA